MRLYDEKRVPWKERICGHLSFWLILWPIFTIFAAIIASGEHPLTQQAPASVAAIAAVAGVLTLWPEFLFCALVLSAATVLIFTFAGHRKPFTVELLLEAGVAFGSLALGISLQYPTVLSNAILGGLRSYTVLALTYGLTASVTAVAIAMAMRAKRLHGVWVGPCVVAAFMAAGYGLTLVPTYVPAAHPHADNVVLMGVDSLSQTDQVAEINNFARQHGGTVYTHAVTPGLLTNAVWTSIIMHRPVHETKVLITFQTPDWSRSPFQLIRMAHNSGYETWSFITDQFTSYVGSLGGFDYDRSSPMGWRQISTSSVKNASVLMPMIVSRLPKLPFSSTRPNQTNTYCYNLRAALRTILTAGTGEKPAFVATHVEYLHQTAYPGYPDLTARERDLVRHSKVSSLQDYSLHWYAPEADGEPLGINDWKEAHLQKVLAEELIATGYLDPARHNRLVIFSDHGQRTGLDNDNFGQPRYYNVLFTTFGIPATTDPEAPISLLEIPRLLGFVDPSRKDPANPVTEYVNLSTQEFKDAVHGVKVKFDGRLDMPKDILSQPEHRLRAYVPAENEYVDVQVGNAPDQSTVSSASMSGRK